MKCVVCDKEEKKWYICSTCLEVLKKKYPNYEDLVKVVKQHKKERLGGEK